MLDNESIASYLTKEVSSPLVSIIIATFNRSDVLWYAIESVRRNSIKDWELLVIGDACSDDTAEVVASFSDPRITFFNLPSNVGEQSGPNNEGLRRAKGDFIAFINHDDIWLEDHLELGIRTLEALQVDLAIAVPLIVKDDRPEFILNPITGGSFYRTDWFPASSWIFRRKLVDDVGYWRFYRDCWAVPSQDWLRRIWNAGFRIASTNCLSLIVIGSGHRKNSYVSRDSTLHKKYFDGSSNPHQFRHKSLPISAIPFIKTRRNFGSAARAITYRIVALVGIPPNVFMNTLRYRKKGKHIDNLRETRGLPFLPRNR